MSQHATDEEIDALIDPEIREEIGDPIPIPTAATVVYVPVLLLGLGLATFWQKTFPGPNFWWPRVLEDAALGFAVGLALVIVTWGLARYLRPLQELEEEFRRVLGPLPIQRILALAFLSGVAEEVLFRGTLQPWMGYVATSILFGCLHFVPSAIFLPWTLFALGCGFLFGWIFDLRDSLIAPVVAHVTVNAMNLFLIVRGKRGS